MLALQPNWLERKWYTKTTGKSKLVRTRHGAPQRPVDQRTPPRATGPWPLQSAQNFADLVLAVAGHVVGEGVGPAGVGRPVGRGAVDDEGCEEDAVPRLHRDGHALLPFVVAAGQEDAEGFLVPLMVLQPPAVAAGDKLQTAVFEGHWIDGELAVEHHGLVFIGFPVGVVLMPGRCRADAGLFGQELAVVEGDLRMHQFGYDIDERVAAEDAVDGGADQFAVHQLTDDLALVGRVLVLPGDVNIGRRVGHHAPVDVFQFLADLPDLLQGDEAFFEQNSRWLQRILFLGWKDSSDSSLCVLPVQVHAVSFGVCRLWRRAMCISSSLFSLRYTI